MMQCLQVKESYETLYFSHTYREINSMANQLSKEALLLQKGTLYEQEFKEGNQVVVENVLF
jgi:hypothetical protein